METFSGSNNVYNNLLFWTVLVYYATQHVDVLFDSRSYQQTADFCDFFTVSQFT